MAQSKELKILSLGGLRLYGELSRSASLTFMQMEAESEGCPAWKY